MLTTEFLCILNKELPSESARLPIAQLLWKLLEDSPKVVNMPDDIFVAEVPGFIHTFGTPEPR